MRLAHAKGARVLVDCYQSVGSMDIDVKAWDVDFAVGGMLKYLLGTAGIGFLLRALRWYRVVPTNSGWFAGPDRCHGHHGHHPAPNARRFEAGTPAVVNCYAAEAGLRLLLRVGAPAIERRIAALTRRCMLRLAEVGWPSVTPTPDERRGATVALPSRDSSRLTAELLQARYRDVSSGRQRAGELSLLQQRR